MGKYRSYERYKDSGVQWLRMIPEHWELCRMRFIVETNPNKNEIEIDKKYLASFVPMEAVQEYGGINLDNEKIIEDVFNNYTYFANGDVIIAKITPCFENGKSSIAYNLTNGIAFGTTEIHVLRAKHNLSNHYLFYLVISHLFRHLGEAEMYGAGGQKRISEDFIRNFIIAFPPLEEQKIIARFLDYKTQQIDELIAKKETLLEKLDEKRIAIISHAVTKGLDPNVPMKDSGVEWLGEIPEHWKVIRIKRAFILQRGVDIRQEEQTEGTIPVVSSGGIASYHNVAYAKPPGVLVGRKGTVGNVHYIDVDYWPHDTTLWVIEFYDNDPHFIYYKLLSMKLENLDTGSANPTLNRNLIHPLKTSWTSNKEQKAIATYLDRQTAEIDRQKAKIQEGIELLKEYRTALITNAVTGKIDLRQIPIPQD